MGFKASKYDECLFYHGNTIFIVYTDDTTVTKQDLNRFIIKKQSPTQLSVRTQDTYAETIPTIQPRNQIHKPSHISPAIALSYQNSPSSKILFNFSQSSRGTATAF